jgi:tetrahydromethanopterin S-methyltransferase subunit D
VIRFNKTISATELLSVGTVPDGRARHQIAVSDGAGTLEVRVNFGAGLTSVTTISAAETARVPYCLEAEIDEIELVPSGAVSVCYRAEHV